MNSHLLDCCFWLNQPSHHQREFLSALSTRMPLQVRYFGRTPADRVRMGWADPAQVREWEAWFDPAGNPAAALPDWRRYIHVVPGTVGNAMLMKWTRRLSVERVPWIHWSENVHPGMNYLLRLPLRLLYARRIARHALGAFAISRLAANDFRNWGIPERLIRFQPYAINPVQASIKTEALWPDLPRHSFKFLYCGQFCHRKAIDILLKSFAPLARTFSKALLLLAGPDGVDRARYVRLANELGLTAQTRFAGPFPCTDAGAVMAAADVLILPSRHDGWGMVVYEAACLAKPLIVSDRCGSAWHLVVPGWNGAIIRAGDVSSCQAAMESYLLNPQWATRHGRRSALLAQDFSAESMAELFVENLRSLSGPQAQACAAE